MNNTRQGNILNIYAKRARNSTDQISEKPLTKGLQDLDVRTRRTLIQALQKEEEKIDEYDIISIKYDPLIQAKIRNTIPYAGERTLTKILCVADSLEKAAREAAGSKGKTDNKMSEISDKIKERIRKRIKKFSRPQIEGIILSGKNEEERKKLREAVKEAARKLK